MEVWKMPFYTFNGTIQTMTFYQTGKVTAWGENEDDARYNAKKKLNDIHRVGSSCINLKECTKVEGEE
jgi:L,D-peptidoglycan transpeptidase YkuD (ErfK/YbiS/YcfS/YnhG family)